MHARDVVIWGIFFIQNAIHWIVNPRNFQEIVLKLFAVEKGEIFLWFCRIRALVYIEFVAKVVNTTQLDSWRWHNQVKRVIVYGLLLISFAGKCSLFIRKVLPYKAVNSGKYRWKYVLLMIKTWRQGKYHAKIAKELRYAKLWCFLCVSELWDSNMHPVSTI